jgi:hypothetical protein
MISNSVAVVFSEESLPGILSAVVPLQLSYALFYTPGTDTVIKIVGACLPAKAGIYWRYFTDNHFTDIRTGTKKIQGHRLYRISYVPIRYHVKIKSNANPYLPEFDKYFFQRQKWREDLAKDCHQITTFDVKVTNINSRVSFRRESFKCA